MIGYIGSLKDQDQGKAIEEVLEQSQKQLESQQNLIDKTGYFQVDIKAYDEELVSHKNTVVNIIDATRTNFLANITKVRKDIKQFSGQIIKAKKWQENEKLINEKRIISAKEFILKSRHQLIGMSYNSQAKKSDNQKQLSVALMEIEKQKKKEKAEEEKKLADFKA